MDFQRFVEELRERRPPHTDAYNLVVLAHTDSTNLVARGVAVDLEAEGLDLPPMLVVAFEQSGGRGRLGRSWSSPRGRGVYATVARAYAEPELLPALPLLVGVGLCTALSPHLPGGCGLKWPNDLVVPGPAAGGRGARAADADAAAAAPPWRKIGGVLIEALIHPGNGCVALIGFGVNHGHRPEDLPAGATSLQLEIAAADPATAGVGGVEAGAAAATPAAPPAAGHAAEPVTAHAGVGLAQLTWDLAAGVERELTHAGDLDYAVAAYRRLSVHRPGDRMVCRVGDQEVTGTFGGFDDHGHLRLERPAALGGELIVSAGEVIER